MAGRLLNKVAVITGSTEGLLLNLWKVAFKFNFFLIILFESRIGFSIAQRFAKEGAKVVISSRNKDKVAKALEELKSQNFDCHGVSCHVAKAEDRTKLIEEVIKNLFFVLYLNKIIFYIGKGC